MTGSFEKWIVIGVIVLNAYSLGANCVERFVNYQSWPRLAGADFGPYHRSQQPWILGFVVGPLAFGPFVPGSTVIEFLGNGHGVSSLNSSIGVSNQFVGIPPVVADFNGDGKLDMAVATGDNGGTISILLQR